jgi:hypothetical protein
MYSERRMLKATMKTVPKIISDEALIVKECKNLMIPPNAANLNCLGFLYVFLVLGNNRFRLWDILASKATCSQVHSLTNLLTNSHIIPFGSLCLT